MNPSARSQQIADWARKWNAGLTRFLRRRVPNRIDAEDLAQEVYVRLLRVETLDSIKEPQAYVYRVASNVASEWRMRASQRKPHSADELESLVTSMSPEVQIDDEELADELNEALTKMSPMIRTVTYLKVREGMSHEDIAVHLAITPRMVRRLLGQGYAQLRDSIELER